MATNNNNMEFRRVNIDQYCEREFPDEDEELQKQADESINNFIYELDNNLNQGNNLIALNMILDKPHQSNLLQSEKNRLVLFVIRILQTFKQKEIDSVLEKLSSSQLDILMKYIYRGFEFPNESASANLLLWQDKVYQIGGLGCILRVMTNIKKKV